MLIFFGNDHPCCGNVMINLSASNISVAGIQAKFSDNVACENMLPSNK